jgi:hypothetical protein
LRSCVAHPPRSRRRRPCAGGSRRSGEVGRVRRGSAASRSGPAAPSLAQAAGLAALPATAGAPAPQPGQPKLLDATMGSLAFPNWLEKFGWKATGLRSDTIGGRDATTVFYEKNGKRIGYTIVDGDPLDVPENAGRARREGTDLRILEIAGRPVVTWEREGKTCILTGSAEPGVLAKLAAWKGKGAVPF